MNISVASSWIYWEKHKHHALIALAILLSAALASAARNERRMFVLPEQVFAFAAIPAPEPTGLRSAIMGYLDDGCQPELSAVARAFDRVVDEADCGKGRKRVPGSAVVREPDPEPFAFFARPDVPIVIDEMEIPDITPDTPPYQRIALNGRASFFEPVRPAAIAPPILASGVPEPRSWALLILGFLCVGAGLRRRADLPASVIR